MGGTGNWVRYRATRGGETVSWMRTVQWICGSAGALLIMVWLVAWVHGRVLSNRSLTRFEAARVAVERMERSEEPLDGPVDTSLWDTGRIEEYQESLFHDFGLPLGVLRIPSIDVVVPVLRGTDDLTLNRGVGWIEGTAEIGSSGNIGIAGHRDGFFRGFKDLEIGAEIVVETLDGARTYVVEDTTIVEPSDVSVLAPTQVPTLTLVTCYPFYYVGSAPQRFIVHAVGRDESAIFSPELIDPESQRDNPEINSAGREFSR